MTYRRQANQKSVPIVTGKQHYATTWYQEQLCERMVARTACRAAWNAFTISQAVRIKPAADIRRLERAFKQVQQKHEVLRTNFVQIRGVWRAVIHPDARAKVQVSEHGPLDEQAQQALLRQQLGAGFEADAPPVSLHLLRFGSEGDVVLLQISHLVTDGYGSSLIFKDLVNAAVGVPLVSNAVSYREFEQVYVKQPRELIDAGQSYWRDRLLPPPAPVPIGLAKTGRHRIDRFATERCYRELFVSMSDKDSKRFQKRARSFGCTPFSMLCSGLFHAVRVICGADEMDFGTLLGRSDARLANWSGLAVTNLPAVIRDSDGEDFAARTKALHHQLQTSMQHLPHPAVHPAHEVMQRFVELGGTPDRIRVRIPGYKPRNSMSSILSAMLEDGKSSQVGRYQVERVSAKVVTSISELMLSYSQEAGRTQVSFIYDADAFSEEELRNLASLTASAMLDG